jgi:hypothetical protein
MERAGAQTDQQLRFLRDLLEENAWISGDVLQIGTAMWAVHGVILVDGNVLMAEFDSYDEARRALDQLGNAPGPADSRRATARVPAAAEAGRYSESSGG